MCVSLSVTRICKNQTAVLSPLPSWCVPLLMALLLLQHYYMKNEVLGLPPPLEFEEPQGAADMSGMYSDPLICFLHPRCRQAVHQSLTDVCIRHLASGFVCLLFSRVSLPAP